MNPQLSIIVPAKNAAKTIERCLRAVGRQEGVPRALYQVIVVDNDSTDATAQLATPLADRVLFEACPGAGAARNRGAAEADAPWLVFLDSDCVPESTWLAAFVEASRVGTDMMYGGPIRAEHGAGPIARFVENLYDHEAAIERYAPASIISANFMIRARDFGALGGFSELTHLGHDVELSYLAVYGKRATFQYVPGAVVRHFNANSYVGVFLKAVEHGRAAASVLEQFEDQLGTGVLRRAERGGGYADLARRSAARLTRWLRREPQDAAAERALLEALVLAGKHAGLLIELASERRSDRSRAPWIELP